MVKALANNFLLTSTYLFSQFQAWSLFSIFVNGYFQLFLSTKKYCNYCIFCITYVLFSYFVWSMFPQQYKIKKIINFLDRFLFTTSVFVAMMRSHSLDIAAGTAVGWPGLLRIRVSSISSTGERFVWSPTWTVVALKDFHGRHINQQSRRRAMVVYFDSTRQAASLVMDVDAYCCQVACGSSLPLVWRH